MAYEGGYTSAVNSEAHRGSQNAYIAQVAQALAHQQWIRDQQAQQLQRDLQAQAQAGAGLLRMAPPPAGAEQPQPPSAPPGMPLQPPMPGQASVPMMMPPPGAGSAANMMQGALSGGPPPAPMAPPGGAPPGPMDSAATPAIPAGWKPSPVAPPELGGQPPAPAAPDARTGTAGGAPPLLAPPTTGKIPTQMLSVPLAIQTLKDMKVPPEQMVMAIEKMLPTINAQNSEALNTFKAETAAKAAAEKAYNDTLKAMAAQTTAGANVTKAGAAVTAADAKAGQAADTVDLTPDALDAAAYRYNWNGTIAGIYRDPNTKKLIMNRAAELKKGAGVDAAQVPVEQASNKADTGSLAFQQKRVDAIEGSMKKIDKDITTLETVLNKGAFSEARVVNVPINQLRRMISDPDLAKLDLAANQVGTEYERLLTGGMMSVAQLHVGAQEDAKKLISGDMAPKEIRAKLPVMRQEMDNAKNAATEQLKEITDRMSTRSKGGAKSAPASKPAAFNAKGWKLMSDPSGAMAYVSPDGKQFEEVR